MRSLRLFLFALLTLTGCDGSAPADAGPDARVDAFVPSTDSGAPPHDSGIDAGSSDDAGAGDEEDAGNADAGLDGGYVTGLDAGACGAIGAGHTIPLDGVGDQADYPASQVLNPGATDSSGDTFALSWDRDFLYITLFAAALTGDEGQFRPLHVYLEAASALGAVSESTGKEYSGVEPHLPFTATHLIAVRRTSDSGEGGPYNGVYTAASGWVDRATPLDEGTDYWASGSTISVKVPWAALGCPSELRLSAHVVNGVFTQEWKDTVPADATSWLAPGGAYYELDLSEDPAVSGWSLRGAP